MGSPHLGSKPGWLGTEAAPNKGSSPRGSIGYGGSSRWLFVEPWNFESHDGRIGGWVLCIVPQRRLGQGKNSGSSISDEGKVRSAKRIIPVCHTQSGWLERGETLHLGWVNRDGPAQQVIEGGVSGAALSAPFIDRGGINEANAGCFLLGGVCAPGTNSRWE